jgi:uncharacterized protein (TIGR00369 family)
LTALVQGGVDNPLLDDLGIQAVDMAAGSACFEIDLRARHLNRQGSLHGGVIVTLLDMQVWQRQTARSSATPSP